MKKAAKPQKPKSSNETYVIENLDENRMFTTRSKSGIARIIGLPVSTLYYKMSRLPVGYLRFTHGNFVITKAKIVKS